MIPSYPRLVERGLGKEGRGGGGRREIYSLHAHATWQTCTWGIWTWGCQQSRKKFQFLFSPLLERKEGKKERKETGETHWSSWNRFAWINFHSIEWLPPLLLSLCLCVLFFSFLSIFFLAFPSRRCDFTWCGTRIWMDWLERVDFNRVGLKIRMNYRGTCFNIMKNPFWFICSSNLKINILSVSDQLIFSLLFF